MSHHRRNSSSRGGSAPAWFRYGVIALAAIIMCSCSRPARVHGAEVDSPTCYDDPAGECPSEGCPTGECACCNPDVPGPGDEYLCDGGDFGYPATVQKDSRIKGLEQEDAIAHYDTLDGETYVTPSNKVCIYAPRFAVVREVVDLHENIRNQMVQGSIDQAGPELAAERLTPSVRLASLEPAIDRLKQPPSLIRDRRHPGELGREQRPGAAIGSLAPYANLQAVRTGEVVGLDIVKIARSSLAAIAWTGVQAPQILIDNRQAIAAVSVQSPGTIYHLREPVDSRLRLIKLASKSDALPGEEVEFTLRFDNVGERVIGNVVIVDNLTTRLEYVEGTQKSDLKADFKTESNEGESLVLRWELADPLPVGKGGVIQFRCRVK